MRITEVLNDLEIPYREIGSHHHTTPGWVQIDCNQCSPHSQKFRLGINLTHLYCSCWQCGYQNLTTTLAEISNQSISTITKLLDGLDVAPIRKQPKSSPPPADTGPLLPAHIKYLKKRGFRPNEIVDKWKISGIGIAAKLSWRILIPIHHNSKEISWTTRSIVDDGKRYLSAPNVRKHLYGVDHCKHTIIVLEGPLDVWRVGFGSVATLGISYSREQVATIAKFPERIVCFDAESMAQRQARKLCRELSAFPGKTTNVILSTGKDPSRASGKEVNKLRRFLR